MKSPPQTHSSPSHNTHTHRLCSWPNWGSSGPILCTLHIHYFEGLFTIKATIPDVQDPSVSITHIAVFRSLFLVSIFPLCEHLFYIIEIPKKKKKNPKPFSHGLYIISTFPCYHRLKMYLLNGCGTSFPSVRHFVSSQIFTRAKLLPEHLWHIKCFFGVSFWDKFPRLLLLSQRV